LPFLHLAGAANVLTDGMFKTIKKCVRAAGTGALAFAVLSQPAAAAETIDGAHLPLWLGLPFLGILLSIALGPLFARRLWHIHYGKASAFWALLALAMMVFVEGWPATAAAFVHNMVLDYLPFILMLFALFTAAGGIAVRGTLPGTPLVNTAVLAIGAGLASLIGTTGASLILIRPLLRANEERRAKAHIVIFFIFLVSNIGGALTPLGDPPLFLGFLHGVDFFWTAQHLWREALFAIGVLLALFFVIDRRFHASESKKRDKRERKLKPPPEPLRVGGLVNIPLIAIAIAAVVASGLWRPGVALTWLGTHIEVQNMMRDGVMIAVGLASLALTGAAERKANRFEWEPIKEVAQLFAGIFTCIIPVMAMLQAGEQGPFAPVIALLTHADGTPRNAVYFWGTGLLSSFLDNAPTYLVFFQLAGDDNPAHLMGPLAATLAAISLGAVFMGAMTYIGNAPNFMVYAIARRQRVDMPSFFGYLAWSGMVLIPLFAAITFLFIR
jgi:Na+/H+ antiporter NhaD/arsenite permease-like protein